MDILVTFGVGNRITIPANVVNELKLQPGTKLKLEIQNGDILLSTHYKVSQCTHDLSTKKDTTNKKGNINNNPNKRKIVSNLEEGQKFSKKYYSPCKLVIRTKNSYLKNFCNDCQGLLVENDIEKQSLCPFKTNQNLTPKEEVHQKELVEEPKQIQHNRTKTIKTDIENNVKVLNDMLDDRIKNISDSDIQDYEKQKMRVLQPVKSTKYYYQCKQCKQIVTSGFMLDDEFYCKECTKKDFKQFLGKYISMEKGVK